MDYTAGPVQSHRSLRDGDAGVESAGRSRGGPAGAPASWPPPGVDEVKAATFPGPRKELGPRTRCRLLPGTKVKGQLYVLSWLEQPRATNPQAALPRDREPPSAQVRPGPAAARPPTGEASARTPGASPPHPSGAQQNRVPCFHSGACVSGAVRPGRPRLAQTPRRTRRRCQKSQQEGDRAAVRDQHRKTKRDATACKISRSRRYVYYRNTN